MVSRAACRAAHQLVDGDREEGAVNRPQPEQADGSRVRVGKWRMLEAHVDDQSHAQVAQTRVIVHGGRGADEEVGGDGGKVHAPMVSQSFVPQITPTACSKSQSVPAPIKS